MFKLVINLTIQHWVKEYCDSPESFDYGIKAILIAETEEDAKNTASYLENAKSHDLESYLYNHDAIIDIRGDIICRNIYYEPLMPDVYKEN